MAAGFWKRSGAQHQASNRGFECGVRGAVTVHHNGVSCW